MADSKQKSILILDDNEDILELMAEGLKFAGFRVVIATDGMEGERKFKNENFDLVITDLNMPKVDGITFIQRIREKDLSHLIPVIIISGNIYEFKPRFALIDNVSFLEKPFEVTTLADLAKRNLFPEKYKAQDNKGKKVNLKKGETLMREGEIGNSMFWVVNGDLEVVKIKSGKEVRLGQIAEGELVGEMSFLDNLPRSASVRALCDCELLEIPNGRFSEVLEHQPRWFKSLVRVLSERLRAANELIDFKE